MSVFACAAPVTAVDVGEVVAHDRHRDAQLLGRRRIGMEELLGEPDATDVDRHQLLRAVDARDELRRAAADVDDEIRLGLGQAGGRAEELEARLLLAAQQLGPHAPVIRSTGSKNSSRLVASRDALVAVMRTRATSCAAIDVVVLAQHGNRARDRVGIEPARLVHALTQPRDPRPALDRRQPRVATGPVDVGDEQPHRVRPDVDGRDAGHCASSSASAAATQRPTGSSPPARCHA